LYNLFILSFFSWANRQITTTTTTVVNSSSNNSSSKGSSNMMTHSLDLLGKLANGKCSALSKAMKMGCESGCGLLAGKAGEESWRAGKRERCKAR